MASSKKIWIILVVLAAIVILALVVFLMNNSSNQNNNPNLNQSTFSSCIASVQSSPFAQGETYTIRVIGVENGACHWQYSLTGPILNQTTDCNYPLDQMSTDVFNHLFGQDKTGTECSSALCVQQESLQQTYCK